MLPFIRSLLTSKDNQSADIGRVLGLFFAVSLVGQQVYALVEYRQAFDPVQSSTAYAALLVALGVGLRAKATTEPGS